MRLWSADLLVSCTTLLSADKESALTRAKTRVPRNQSRTATRRARASHVVLCLDSPMRTMNLRRSFFVLRTTPLV